LRPLRKDYYAAGFQGALRRPVILLFEPSFFEFGHLTHRNPFGLKINDQILYQEWSLVPRLGRIYKVQADDNIPAIQSILCFFTFSHPQFPQGTASPSP
jgi:hypothetical protein